MRSLIIGREEKEKIKSLIAHAKANVRSIDDLLDMLNKEEPLVGDMDGFSIEIPNGYRVVFSIEDQPAGMIRHLSISIPADNLRCSPDAAQMIMEEFGFTGTLRECNVWIERISEKRDAVNIAEVM